MLASAISIIMTMAVVVYLVREIIRTRKKTIQEEENLANNIIDYITGKRYQLVDEFYSSENKDFLEYLKNILTNAYSSNRFFPKAYKIACKKLPQIFSNDNFTVSSVADVNLIKKTDINVRSSSMAKIELNCDDIMYCIENNCLIRPLFFSSLYHPQTFNEKNNLYLLNENLLEEAFSCCDRLIAMDEKFLHIEMIIQAQLNSFSNFLKSFIKTFDEENFFEDGYFVKPYVNLFIDTKFTYTVSEIPFSNEKNFLVLQKKNEELRKLGEQKEIEECNLLVDEILQNKQSISEVVSNYKTLKTPYSPYFSLILDYFLVPYWGMSEYKFKTFYNEDTGILCVDIQIPSERFAPKNYGIKTILKKTGEVRYKTFTENQFSKAYNDFTYQYALSLLYFIFKMDYNKKVKSICLNGIKSYIDKNDGISKENCILSIHTTRESFEKINLACVDAKSCFKTLKGVAGVDFINVTPVVPLLQFDMKDKRFVEGYDVATQLNETTNLASMDWQDFENLIRDIFEKEFARDGGEVKVTQASRDGGVDAIAFDPDPLRGGKIVIQAKRYTNVVGVSAVRDLYGTVLNEGATKGILVTTSNFGPDAHEFAKNKPITLLSGNNLLYLLEKHGYKAKIDIKEARKILGLAEKVRSN